MSDELPGTPAIVIGKWRIVPMSNGKVWIGIVDDGEGGQFDEVDVANAIGEFYREHF